MKDRIYKSDKGNIYYWISDNLNKDEITLVFLPGLTADHRLFEKQLEYFENKYNCFVWDAPGQGLSWPFILDFDLFYKTELLEKIFVKEGIEKPLIIGQSMGGYVGQAYTELFKNKLKGFISIDSAPLQRNYVTGIEIFLLKYMEPVYLHWPWRNLLSLGSNGVATTEYGRKLMLEMMMVYDGDQKRYAKVAGHGYSMLAKAMEASLEYEFSCPVLLICGKKDHAGSCIRYNKAWHKKTNHPLIWIDNAGHNSNTDKPELVNELIEDFVKKL